MTRKSERKQPSAVYDSDDICGFYSCTLNDIPRLIQAGAIPKPLPTASQKGKRRWIKAIIIRHLRLDELKTTELSGMDINTLAQQIASLITIKQEQKSPPSPAFIKCQ